MDNLRTLRAQWEDRLRGITVPQPFSLTAFAAEVARHRGRRLHILDLPGEASGSPISGVWLATSRADLINIEPAASPFHRRLICLHEIGHMLCGHHASARLGGDDLLRGLFPHLSPDLLRRVLAPARIQHPRRTRGRNRRGDHPRPRRNRPAATDRPGRR
jgi:hypothetical protein